MNDDMLSRVRKLLAVAEHPTTPAGEADAAARAAERLIAKYAIDEALLEVRGSTRSKPEVRTLDIEAPYASAKTILVGAIAGAHGVRAVSQRGFDPVRMTLIGFAGDLAIVDLLYTSLLLQATTAMLRQRLRSRAFRRAFLIGFADEVGSRLRETRREAVDLAGTSTELVLRGRDADVEAAMREQFPRLRTSRATVSDGHGLVAGRQSGATASLATGRNQVANQQRAIS